MAIALASVLSPHDVWSDTKRLHFVRKLTFSGNYTTGGDTLNLASDFAIKSSTPPIYVNVVSKIGGSYSFVYVPGTTMANCLLKIVNTTTGAELAAGAYPAGITGDNPTLYGITLPRR